MTIPAGPAPARSPSRRAGALNPTAREGKERDEMNVIRCEISNDRVGEKTVIPEIRDWTEFLKLSGESVYYGYPSLRATRVTDDGIEIRIDAYRMTTARRITAFNREGAPATYRPHLYRVWTDAQSTEAVIAEVADLTRISIQDSEAFYAVQARVNQAISRDEYESLCGEYGIAPDPDSMMDTHGVFYPPEYSLSECIRHWLWWRRLDGVPTHEVRAPQPAPAEVLCDCGHYCDAQLIMTASLGRTCPGCYDEYSD